MHLKVRDRPGVVLAASSLDLGPGYHYNVVARVPWEVRLDEQPRPTRRMLLRSLIRGWPEPPPGSYVNVPRELVFEFECEPD